MGLAEVQVVVPKKTKIVEGARAPSFRLQADNGDYISLSDFLGKTLILYFYPKDDTAGCTREAIEFTAATKLFAKAGAVIAGVSKDSPARHIKFKEKHQI
jgi:peroxiredoxin Q/BCP